MRKTIALLVFCLNVSVFAQEQDDTLQLSVGAGFVSNDSGYRDNSAQTELIPLVDLHYKRFFVESVVAGYSIVRNENLHWKLILTPSFEQIDRKGGTYTEHLKKRQPSIMAGTQLDFHLANRFQLSFIAKKDVIDNSDGTMVTAEVSRPFIYNDGQTILAPSASLNYQDRKYNDYYYGVAASEALPGRPEYKADSGVNPAVGLFVRHQFNDHLALLGLVRVQKYDNTIEDSPLIDTDKGVLAVFGASWKLK